MVPARVMGISYEPAATLNPEDRTAYLGPVVQEVVDRPFKAANSAVSELFWASRRVKNRRCAAPVGHPERDRGS